MRKDDLEVSRDYHPIDIIRDINLVLYEQGYGIQFVRNAESQGDILAYNLTRSLKLIQE
jgi:hypothetical protein